MPRLVSCRRCGKPSPKSLCEACRSLTYGSSEYARNSALIRHAARQTIQHGHAVFCVICEQRIMAASQVTVEHIRSVSDGGSNELANLAPAHARCNYAKRASR